MRYANRKAVLTVIALLVAGAGGLAWFRSRGDELGAQYKTEPVASGDLAQTVSANGTLNPVILVNVGTQVSGTVQVLHADFNDHVRAGQVLLQLDPSLLRAQLHESEAGLASARAALALAEANEARARPMVAQGYVSKQDYDQLQRAVDSAHAQLQMAQAQVEHDRTNLAYTLIRSPVSGVVVNRAVDVGQTVAANFQTPTLFQIAQDLTKMQIDSSFAEADVGRIHAGQRVRFTVDAFPDRAYDATVQQVRLNPTTQQNVVTYDVVVAVDNADEKLLPGMTAYVSVVLDERRNALRVPNAALRYSPAEKAPLLAAAATPSGNGSRGTAYVLADGGLRPVPLLVGISDGRYTEVVAGDLKAGERVVVGNLASVPAPSASSMRLRVF
jgi:HlyD family secretion protein